MRNIAISMRIARFGDEKVFNDFVTEKEYQKVDEINF
jgi:hypothetical protein